MSNSKKNHSNLISEKNEGKLTPMIQLFCTITDSEFMHILRWITFNYETNSKEIKIMLQLAELVEKHIKESTEMIKTEM